jgi:hypothetical protein
MTYRSFQAAARWTFSEGERPLRRVPYRGPPEGAFSSGSPSLNLVERHDWITSLCGIIWRIEPVSAPLKAWNGEHTRTSGGERPKPMRQIYRQAQRFLSATIRSTTLPSPPQHVTAAVHKSLTKDPKLLLNDDFAGKTEAIYLLIGRRPHAAFSNSTGDRQMLEHTKAGRGRAAGQ